jgi:succinoglycan biosynthesis transport protein ExoP
VAKTFGMLEHPGLNEVLTGIHKLDECLRSISDIIVGNMKLEAIMETPGIENISILPSGHIPHNPAELLDTPMMVELMTQIRNRYDIVLFDSPPILPITDATLLAGRVDGVVLVYEAGRTSRSALQRVKVQLENAGANILGVVLNHINPEVEAASNFPYYYKYKYYKYGYYYGEPSAGKKHAPETI